MPLSVLKNHKAVPSFLSFLPWQMPSACAVARQPRRAPRRGSGVCAPALSPGHGSPDAVIKTRIRACVQQAVKGGVGRTPLRLAPSAAAEPAVSQALTSATCLI